MPILPSVCAVTNAQLIGDVGLAHSHNEIDVEVEEDEDEEEVEEAEDDDEEEVKETLKKDNVILQDYDDVYSFVENLNEGNDVLLDPNTTNYALYNCIPDYCPKIERTNPTLYIYR